MFGEFVFRIFEIVSNFGFRASDILGLSGLTARFTCCLLQPVVVDLVHISSELFTDFS